MGFLANIHGGISAEKLGPKNHKNYSRICMLGSALAWPCFMAGTLITNNFWISIAGLAGKYFLGENYWSPNLAMI